MAKYRERIKAHLLRKQGNSIGEIAKKLDVSKGSASLWCRNLRLTDWQQKKVAQRAIVAGHKGRMIGALMNKNKRVEAIRSANVKAMQIIKKISNRDLLFLGLGLYWGEGSKNGESRFIFVNSDPLVHKAIINWLEKIMHIPQSRLMPQIYINDQHRYRIRNVALYWSKILHIPKKQFRNPVFIHVPHKKVYANHNTYMGVLHLNIEKSSLLKYATMGMLGVIKNQV
ncbi:MAG: hypothetical protein Q7S52_00515 [bacterium]|nr:hypothetical protein [bacterium]